MRTWRSVLMVATALTFAALPRAARAQATVRIRLGTLAPQGTSYHRVLQQMAEQWRTATGGRVQTIVYAGTMGSELEIVRRMRLGQLQAGALTETGLREIDPAVAALEEMPLMFRSLDEAAFVRSRLAPELAQRLADRGFVVLFWADAGWARFFTHTPATRPDDFRHLKMFVTAGETQQFDLMRSAGFQPVSLEWSDALTALQTGMIDVVPTIPYFALSMQFQTVANNMLDLDWAPIVGALVINKRVWDGLDADTRAVIQAAADSAGARFQADGRAESDSAVAAMQRRGLHVIEVPPAAQAEWRQAAERLYPQIRGNLVPADMFDEVVRLLAEYRANPTGR